MNVPPLPTDWQDESQYPGPNYDHTLSELLGSLTQPLIVSGRAFGKVAQLLGKQYQMEMSVVTEELSTFMVTYDEINQINGDEPHHEPPQQIARKRQPPPRHVGPRPTRQFDKRGRRRY